jgi:hypothetical protein
MLRQRIRCDAPSLSLADYDFIMQCRNDRPRSKVLNELKEKYSISQKRIYQIWRGKKKIGLPGINRFIHLILKKIWLMNQFCL